MSKRGRGNYVDELILSYAALVSSEIRDAYLVDCCSIDCRGLVRKLRSFQEEKKITFNCMVVVEMGLDVIIISHDTLLKKLAALARRDWGDHPYLVNIDENLIRLSTDGEIEAITHVLFDTFSPLQILGTEDCHMVNISSSSAINSIVGLPFVAGWLLGYPCIYHSTIARGLPNPLENETLLKISISAERAAMADVSAMMLPIDIMVFTVPVTILTSSMSKFDAFLDVKVKTLEEKLAEAKRKSLLEFIGSISLVKEKYQCDAINL